MCLTKEENIKSVIDDWYPVIEKHNGNGESRLMIIDDGSKDSVYKIMQEYVKDRHYQVNFSSFGI